MAGSGAGLSALVEYDARGDGPIQAADDWFLASLAWSRAEDTYTSGW